MAIHRNLTGAEACHQSAYVQSTDPGAVGALKAWIDTSTTPATHRVRNAANDGWIVVGAAGGATQTDLSYKLHEADIADDYVVSGLLSAVPSPASLTATIPAGVAYVGGRRWAPAAVSRAFTASRDTYADLGTDGVILYAEVANGAAAPATPAGAQRLFRVTTDAAAVTAVADLRDLTPTLRGGGGASPSAATETTAGIAEIATQAETDAGTDDARIVSPLKLAGRGFERTANKFAASGYPGLSATPGTRDGTKFLRDDGTWQAVLAGGGGGPAWCNQGSGAVFGGYKDGDPGYVADQNINTTNTTTPDALRGSARMMLVRLPQSLALTDMKIYTVAALTAAFKLAIYDADTGSLVYGSAAFDTVAQGYSGPSAISGVTLAANKNYWAAICGASTSITAAVRRFGINNPSSNFYGANNSLLGGKSAGIPVIVEMALTSAGVFPTTMNALTATTSGGVAIWLFGTAS
jgi:hypothetical protein